MPKEYIVAEYEDSEIVARLAPDMDTLRSTSGLLTFARDGASVRSRFFAPVGGVDEDPATGSAAVALAAVLGSLGERSGRLTISQGEEVGMPSTIHLTWGNGTAWIGGTVVRDEPRVVDL
jgi:trans-2,3-dihydro-3-hydroxyanthranilate isomerase